MWLITVFEQGHFRIFEFDNKNEAVFALQELNVPAILSFTM